MIKYLSVQPKVSVSKQTQPKVTKTKKTKTKTTKPRLGKKERSIKKNQDLIDSFTDVLVRTKLEKIKSYIRGKGYKI